MEISEADNSNLSLKILYKIGGISAIIAGILFLIEGIAIGVSGSIPTTMLDWFTLFQKNPVLALFDINFPDVIVMFLFIPLVLALFYALKKFNKINVQLATIFAFVGIAIYLASNASLSMLYLSGQYAAATTEAERTLYLGIAQTTFIIAQENGSIYGWGLVNAAGLIFSVMILRNKVFSKISAYMGILANGTLLIFDISIIFIPLTSIVSLLLGFGGGVFMIFWPILIGYQFINKGSLTQ